MHHFDLDPMGFAEQDKTENPEKAMAKASTSEERLEIARGVLGMVKREALKKEAVVSQETFKKEPVPWKLAMHDKSVGCISHLP